MLSELTLEGAIEQHAKIYHSHPEIHQGLQQVRDVYHESPYLFILLSHYSSLAVKKEQIDLDFSGVFEFHHLMMHLFLRHDFFNSLVKSITISDNEFGRGHNDIKSTYCLGAYPNLNHVIFLDFPNKKESLVFDSFNYEGRLAPIIEYLSIGESDNPVRFFLNAVSALSQSIVKFKTIIITNNERKKEFDCSDFDFYKELDTEFLETSKTLLRQYVPAHWFNKKKPHQRDVEAIIAKFNSPNFDSDNIIEAINRIKTNNLTNNSWDERSELAAIFDKLNKICLQCMDSRPIKNARTAITIAK